jgi:hypothetical protein
MGFNQSQSRDSHGRFSTSDASADWRSAPGAHPLTVGEDALREMALIEVSRQQRAAIQAIAAKQAAQQTGGPHAR